MFVYFQVNESKDCNDGTLQLGFVVLTTIKFLRNKHKLDGTAKNKKTIENDKKNQCK